MTTYNVLLQVQAGLKFVSDVLDTDSIRTIPDKTDVLKVQGEIRWGLLYHDTSNLQFDNSINTLETELTNNRHILRQSELGLQDFQRELRYYLDAVIVPLQRHVLQIDIEFEQHIKGLIKGEPAKPVQRIDYQQETGYINTDDPLQQHYEQRRAEWEALCSELLKFKREIKSFLVDLGLIQVTLERFASKIEEKKQKQIVEAPEDADEKQQEQPFKNMETDVLAELIDSKAKAKRVNSQAQEKHERIYRLYDLYIQNGNTPAAAIMKLAHDFRHEYCKDNHKNRITVIQAIIRKRNRERIISNNESIV